jgi:hypothetical protein
MIVPPSTFQCWYDTGLPFHGRDDWLTPTKNDIFCAKVSNTVLSLLESFEECLMMFIPSSSSVGIKCPVAKV